MPDFQDGLEREPIEPSDNVTSPVRDDSESGIYPVVAPTDLTPTFTEDDREKEGNGNGNGNGDNGSTILLQTMEALEEEDAGSMKIEPKPISPMAARHGMTGAAAPGSIMMEKHEKHERFSQSAQKHLAEPIPEGKDKVERRAGSIDMVAGRVFSSGAEGTGMRAAKGRASIDYMRSRASLEGRTVNSLELGRRSIELSHAIQGMASSNMVVGLEELEELHDRLMDLEQEIQEKGEAVTDAERQELETASELLKLKMTQANEEVKSKFMKGRADRGLNILKDYELRKKHVTEEVGAGVELCGVPLSEEAWMGVKLLPCMIIFMLLVAGASKAHSVGGKAIHGQLYTVGPGNPLVWPMSDIDTMVEARIQIPSYTTVGHVPAAGGGGGHRRRAGWFLKMLQAPFYTPEAAVQGFQARTRRAGEEHAVEGGGEDAAVEAHEEHYCDPDARNKTGCYEQKIRAYLVTLTDMHWYDHGKDWSEVKAEGEDAEKLLGEWGMRSNKEQSVLLEFKVPHPEVQQLIIEAGGDYDVGIVINLHSLGPLGPHSVGLGGGIMALVLVLIMTEVLHRTMASMIGAAIALITLAGTNRLPSLSTVISWMDHGTLGLLFGMMIVIGITMKTGVFEWTGVLACKLAKGSKVKLMVLLCTVTAVLSAFLDNVTTILLICPVTCKLCKLVDIDPTPYLISEAIFSNIGGTATMIGDPPNIIIGNMLSEYLDFTAFLINLAPGVIITSPFAYVFLRWYFKEAFADPVLKADIPHLQKLYPITDRVLLVKCSCVLFCIILSFFLHPVTHLDPAWVSILGAVWLLTIFDLHHCHEALMTVEWDTLLFFAALFVVVEGVGELGLLRAIANVLSDLIGGMEIGGRQQAALCLIVWASAIFSAFVDNIPFTATMVPVMVQMVEQVDGLNIEPLAWALAFGACFGGNGTLMGASANIVMASKAEVEGKPISFKEFMKVGFPIMIISTAIANCYLLFLNKVFWQKNVDVSGGN